MTPEFVFVALWIYAALATAINVSQHIRIGRLERRAK